MQHIVTKFGGTSVSSRETWNNIFSITTKHVKNHQQPVIVCSALTQVSNKLEKAIEAALINQFLPIYEDILEGHRQLAEALDVDFALIADDLAQLSQWLTGIALLKQAPAKTRADIMSLGELMMTRLGHAFLNQQGIKAYWYDARRAIITKPVSGGDEINFLSARCEPQHNDDLINTFLKTKADAIITQGFIGSNPHGETVLLGRGGSDTSAGLFAAMLGASLCEIWTDVPGIYTANPHELPHARLLKQLNYEEAQEIASMGAKVLHPNCLPPVRRANIPMVVKFTKMPEHCGTLISRDIDDKAPLIKSIQIKNSITLISIDALSMWQQVGFLADIFDCFRTHGFSVDLLSSSEFNVTLSLDSQAKLRERSSLDALIADLNRFGRARVIEPCSAVSLVGHHIRTVLPQLGPALEVFEDKQVYMMSLASNDLNLTFVVDESQANKLSQKLHQLLIENNPANFYYSKSWHEEFGNAPAKQAPWWEEKRQALLDVAANHAPCYVYDKHTILQRAHELKSLTSIDAVFYALKANPNKDVIKMLSEQGVGFECVSIEELQWVLELCPDIPKSKLLYTPNFASKDEYQRAMQMAGFITIDSLYPLQHWQDMLQNASVIIRVDPGVGAGHHKHVCTGGDESKFGIVKDDIPAVIELIQKLNIKVIGLHTHSGSGILTPDLWQETALMLAELSDSFADIKILNLGGGLGVVEKPGQQPLDFTALDNALLAVKSRYPKLQFWLEPGRYFVSDAGVILARVTQRKEKGKVRFVGVETGMNSLIRPALYGAWHEIVNLTNLHHEKTGFAHIVGPICESADTLGYDRMLPETAEGDVLLIANCGAYGHCMSSHYNLRPPAEEFVLETE